MAVFKKEFNESQDGVELIAATEDRSIRLRQVILTAATAGFARLELGGGENLLPRIHVPASGTVQLMFEAETGVVSGLGEKVKLVSSLVGPDESHSIVLWYDLVT